VIGNNRLVVDAAADEAVRLGYGPHVLTRSLDGEAREAAARLVALAREIREGRGPVAAPACVIAAGETTVTVRGRGRGGRCQEFALAAALAMEGVGGIVALAAGTDGRDGPTDAAGAIVDGSTWAAIAAAGRDPQRDLARHDAYAALNAVGGLLRPGLTGTNVMDIVIGVST